MATGRNEYSALWHYPTNFKEGIDWLITYSFFSNEAEIVLKELNINIENKAVKKLIDFMHPLRVSIVGSSITQCYSNMVIYQEPMCKAAGKIGNKDSCCLRIAPSNHKCSACPEKDTCDGKCCKYCPQQICARIFCLLIPLILSVLKYMKKMYSTEWKSENGKIKDNEKLKAFFRSLGYGQTDLEAIEINATNISSALEKATTELGVFYNAIYKPLIENDQETFFIREPDTAVLNPPDNIRPILLWLLFLPYSSMYKVVLEEADKLINEQQGKSILKDGSKLKILIEQLPMLFIHIEGKGSVSVGNSMFMCIGRLAAANHIFKKEYYTAVNASKILLSILPVLQRMLDALNGRCIEKSCKKELMNCPKIKQLLDSSLGWNDKVNGAITCDVFKSYLTESIISKGLDPIITALKKTWKNGVNLQSNKSSPVNNHEPTNIREMLLWLQCLPSSGMLDELKMKINESLDGSATKLMHSFVQVIFELPFFYLNLEGNLNTLLTDLFKYQGIDTPGTAFSYTKDGESCLKLFTSITAILYMSLRYLQQQCNDKGDWRELRLDGKQVNNAPDGVEYTDLKSFLTFMGFSTISPIENEMKGSTFNKNTIDKCFGELSTLGGDNELYKLYHCVLEYFKKHHSNMATSQPINPTTIRQMMLWLIGLPLTTQYNNLTTGGGKLSNTGIQKVVVDTSSITSEKLNESVLTSACGLAVTMIVIEGNAKTVLDFLKGGFRDGIQEPYSYGNTHDNGDSCFELLKDYSYKVHCQLRFLHYMTRESSDNGGWKECKYGNGANLPNGKCSGCSAKISCLMHFLEGESKDIYENRPLSPGEDRNEFYGLVTTVDDSTVKDVGMGFTKKLNSNPYRTGNDIKLSICHICHTEVAKPLTQVMEYIVTIGCIEPTTLGDYIDLVRQFTCTGKDLWSHRSINSKSKQGTIEESLRKQLAILDGTDNTGTQYVNELSTAIKSVYPQNHNGNHSQPTYDLFSLGCNDKQKHGKTCAPYIRPIGYSLWNCYAPKIEPSDPNKNGFHTLQWLYDMCYGLLRRLQQLKDAFDKCDCCSNARCGNSIVECKKALPMLYKEGLAFHSPGDLKASTKNCQGIMTLLKQITAVSNPLCKVFKKIIETFYHILLIKVKECVSTIADPLHTSLFKGRKEDQEQWKTAFETYVNEAIKKSKEKLECTYLCTLFGIKDCKTHNSETTASPSIPISVSSEKVTTMEAVIPLYTPPHIDLYDYITYPKQGVVQSAEQISNPYVFADAINFHVGRAQCITPSPVSLRSVIDWLLRITVGKVDKEQNANIKSLTEALKTVFKASAEVAGVEDHVTSLVSGLRKFVGYEDKSSDVVTNLKHEKEGVITEFGKRIEAMDGFLKGKNDFATEMGRALLKGRYDHRKNNLVGGEENFRQTLIVFQNILTSKHTHCNVIQCTGFKVTDSPSPNTKAQAEGLKQLDEFFQKLKTFAANWDNIGKDHGNNILKNQKGNAMGEIKYNPTSKPSGQYFTKLYEALEKLGDCADMVSDLDNTGGGCTKSSEYRGKIKTVIDHLQNQVLSRLKDSMDPESNEKSDPAYAVQACKELIKLTMSNVVTEITKVIKEGVETKYTELSKQHNGPCNAHSGSNHNQLKEYLCIETFLKSITNAIGGEIENYKDHLYDLKALCQWLYRMGQLYNAGLQGFVKSLIKHMEHIIDVIKWIEGIEQMIKKLKEIGTKESILNTDVFSSNEDIKNCCITHNTLYNSNKFDNRDKFFSALNCRINNLLQSYVLGPLPKGTDQTDDKQNVDKRCKFLTELRLLALDRYTLQVWQDDKTRIKDWITFQDGIVRHSDLEAVKTALENLTGVAYNNSAPSSTTRSRIHDFHAICVIQKFNFQEPITRFEKSLEKLKGIQKQLSDVKGKCTNGHTNLSSDATVIQPFCTAVSQFLAEEYGIYSFAKFLHTILGPNIFTAMIRAMEQLKGTTELNEQNDIRRLKKTGFYKSVEALLEGPENAIENRRNEAYTLEKICENLNSFINTLKKEYIFLYPVVSSTASLPAGPQDLQQHPLPKIPTCYTTEHVTSSICNGCYPYLARMFIGVIPNLYRHCRMLYEMCKQDSTKEACWSTDLLTFKKNGVYENHMQYLSLGGYMSRNGWIVKGHDPAMDTNELYELNSDSNGSRIPISLEDIISFNDPLMADDLKPLEALFKTVTGHFWKVREKQRRERETREEHIFNEQERLKKSGLKFVAPPPQLPSTVREVLFWLHELDTRTDFYDGFRDHIRALCGQATIGISDRVISHVLKLSITQCLEVLSTIEDPGRQYPTYLYDLYTEEHYYAYPTVNVSLFFYTFVEKLMAAFLELNFVCVQCQFRALEGGWSECLFYGEDTVASRYKRGVKCECRPSFVGYTCSKPLSAFLFSDPKNQLKVPADQNSRLPYMSKGTMPCGFQLTKAKDTDAKSSTAKSSPVTGSVLVEPLRKLVGAHVEGRYNDNIVNSLNTVVYLRDLLRYTLCLAVRPPWSMSENMAFFYRVTESWRNKGVRSVAQGNNELLQSIHAEIDLFPGNFDGTKLTSAVERFSGLEDKNHDQRTGSTDSHDYDLRTLMGCKETNTSGANGQCSPFIFPLALDVYTHYDHKNSRAYLSWILNFAFGIYDQLKALEEMIKGSVCVTKNTSLSNSDCASLPMCLGVLTALYQSGSSFMDQKALADKNTVNNIKKKTCNDFHTVIHGLFDCSQDYCTPLHNLIVQCEAFLWSIRLPFSLVQLSLWSVAVLFISYVFVVPLDHFKIKSHLFNRLKYTMHPSLLISDGQRRVSEVAYFSL